ncbi:hypothetical protein H5410_061609 [Solanum commersonii]|uniref:Uncharacterized protein n=1 Tax=Solanum commersonii TaxID=4109 RepID=A0A9J5W868_SOLCO|nr:hypothetical protein H5410_061609 [Solanum commersonii]
MLKAKAKRRGTRPKVGSPSSSAIPTNCAEWIIRSTLFYNYKYPLKFRGRKTKTTKLIAGGIGSTWVQLERVNPSPSPTHSARETKSSKAEAVLKTETRCSREIESIQGIAPVGLDPNPFGWVILLLYNRRHLNYKFCLDYVNISKLKRDIQKQKFGEL